MTFCGAALAVGALAAANGGYFPGSWGWASLAFAWAAALALALRGSFSLGRLELVYVGALGALTAWYLLSIVWSSTVPSSVFESERALIYVSGVAAALLVVRRASLAQLIAGVLTGIVAVDLYALGTRLLPDRIGVYDPTAPYRLAVPVGYWNGLGILSVMGTLLALALVVRGRGATARGLAALPLPFLLTTLYFTYSRGSWIALGVALVVVVALDARRLQLVTAACLVSVPSALAVWLASRSHALTTQGAPTLAAAHAGHRLALVLAGLAIAASAAAVGCILAERTIVVPRVMRVGYGIALSAVAITGVALVLAHFGGPSTAASRAWHSFTAPPARVTGSLNKRLLSLSSNGRTALWHSAWHEARAHPWLGGGAGSYEQWWNAHRSSTLNVQDAHNLYLETLAELGPLGLALLVAALAAPLGAAVMARRQRFVPLVCGAYVAYVVHAAADWDWELAGVTFAALLCGAALMIATRRRGRESELSWRVRGPAVVAAVVIIGISVVVVVGNAKLGSATGALAKSDWQKAAHQARTASRWMPWSSAPWRALGEAQLAEGQLASAQVSLRTAIAKDPRDWHLWLDLAAATKGAAHRRAIDRATQLNPLSPDIASIG